MHRSMRIHSESTYVPYNRFCVFIVCIRKVSRKLLTDAELGKCDKVMTKLSAMGGFFDKFEMLQISSRKNGSYSWQSLLTQS